MSTLTLDDRLAGVLLHPTSLPSGKLDDDVFRWLDWLAGAGIHVWQFLPLGVPQADLSPYQCLSAFAANPALLPEDLPEIDDADFQQWKQQEQYWLTDYSLFIALKDHYQEKPWYEWNSDYKCRDEKALQAFRDDNQSACEEIERQQYQLAKCWQRVRNYAHERNILLFGDMPIFVAYDSADVWANQELFQLDVDGNPTVVAGVPPDYFSETGQRWGNPHYDWGKMQEDGFSWWIQRLTHHFQWFDLVRIDHFRGLEAVWVINADCETAIDGFWQKTPGDILLSTLAEKVGQKTQGKLPLVAEDLGIITPEVVALRKKYNLPGMAILQFSFDYFDDNPHKPKNIKPDCVVYTGTHDNATTQGWFHELTQEEKQRVMDVLELEDESLVLDSMINNALSSPANLAILPLQDMLGLGNEARMNIPGTVENNWQWKFDWEQLSLALAAKTNAQLKQTNRIPNEHG